MSLQSWLIDVLIYAILFFGVAFIVLQYINKKGHSKLKVVKTSIVSTFVFCVAVFLFGLQYKVVFPQPAKLVPMNIYIHRDNAKLFPTCDLEFVIENVNNFPISIELKTIRFFDSYACDFGEAEQVIKNIPSKTKNRYTISFNTELLDSVLKTPQEASSAEFTIIYFETGTKTLDSVSLTDKDVVKCTYRQNPLFSSHEEALEFGTNGLAFIVSYTDSEGKSGNRDSSSWSYFDNSTYREINLAWSASKIRKEGQYSFSFNKKIYRRRYGGLYIGILDEDKENWEANPNPFERIKSAGDYAAKELTGLELAYDLSLPKEFIHYTFDEKDKREEFQLLQENASANIIFVYEDHYGVESWVTNLRDKGYHAGLKGETFENFFRNIIFQSTDSAKTDDLINEINFNVHNINETLKSDGFILFAPTILENTFINRIIQDVVKTTSKSKYTRLNFHAHQYKSIFDEAPFVPPVIVVINFEPRTRERPIDSIHVSGFKYSNN
ncbi:MAG: hypothetical protein QQN41_08350 [Nitrosopumilus sp.]